MKFFKTIASYIPGTQAWTQRREAKQAAPALQNPTRNIAFKDNISRHARPSRPQPYARPTAASQSRLREERSRRNADDFAFWPYGDISTSRTQVEPDQQPAPFHGGGGNFGGGGSSGQWEDNTPSQNDDAGGVDTDSGGGGGDMSDIRNEASMAFSNMFENAHPLARESRRQMRTRLLNRD